MRRPRYAWVPAVCLAVFAAGCRPGRARETVVFALVADLSADVEAEAPGGGGDAARGCLARTVSEINQADDVRFAVVFADLVGQRRPAALDRLKRALGELTKPYYVVLGPGRPAAGDGGSDDLKPGEEPDTNHSAPPGGSALLVWSLRGHGFDGPEPYWHATVGGGVVLVALHTAGPGADSPGHVDAEQLQWLDRTLAAYPNDAVVVLTYHALVPFHAFDTTVFWAHHLVDNRAEVLSRLARHKNVAMVLSASHRFAAGKAVGNVVHLTVPGLSTWPLAYDLVSVGPERIERQAVPVGTDDQTRAAFDRLVAQPTLRSLFGESERNLDQIMQVFGGPKTGSWDLSTMRP